MSAAFGATSTATAATAGNVAAGGGAVLARDVCVAEFRAGVTACLRSWSALRAAAESGWGGNESLQKAEDLRNIIYSIMDFSACPPRNYNDVQDIQDNLFDYMESEFSVVLEDASDKQVANVLWRMYEMCYHGDVSLARQVVASAGVAEALLVQYPVKVQTTEEDDDDDDDDEDDNDMVGNEQMIGDENGMDVDEVAPDLTSIQPSNININQTTNNSAAFSPLEYASTPLFGATRKAKKPLDNKPVRQLGEPANPPEKTEMEMDEEGFAPVTTRRRKPRSNVN